MDGSNTVTNTVQQFKENNYVVIRNIIPDALTQHLYNYTILKRRACQTMILRGRLAPDNWVGGFTSDQVPDAFGCYADFAMETLMQDLQGKIYCNILIKK